MIQEESEPGKSRVSANNHLERVAGNIFFSTDKIQLSPPLNNSHFTHSIGTGNLRLYIPLQPSSQCPGPSRCPVSSQLSTSKCPNLRTIRQSSATPARNMPDKPTNYTHTFASRVLVFVTSEAMRQVCPTMTFANWIETRGLEQPQHRRSGVRNKQWQKQVDEWIRRQNGGGRRGFAERKS
jgi:hypothetical protein